MRDYFGTKASLGKIFVGNCMDYLSKCPDGFFNVILTDIPYGECDIEDGGIWKHYNSNQDNMHKADTLDISLSELLSELDRVTTDSFHIFCGMGQLSDIFKYFKSKGYSTRVLVWEKTNPVPINASHTYLSGIEVGVYAKKPDGLFNNQNINTVFRYHIQGGKGLHPTRKSLSLFEELIRNSSQKGYRVLDPFIGSGTTGKVCRALGVEWAGCEINPIFAEDASKNIKRGIF